MVRDGYLMNNKKEKISKNLRYIRKERCKSLKKLRKARDIASKDATIRRRKSSVWKLKDLEEFYEYDIGCLFIGDLAMEIYNANGRWYRSIQAPPVPLKK